MKNKSPSEIAKLLNMCTFLEKENIYVSKHGEDFQSALFKNFEIKNRNDLPFTISDIKEQPTWESFKFVGKNDFKFICELKAQPLKITLQNDEYKIKNEKIIPTNFSNENAREIFSNFLGLTYIITCVDNEDKNIEYFIKIGSSRTTFKARLSSYNCGCLGNWRTASTTNIKILQSMVSTNCTFKLYLLEGEKPTIYNWHGIESVPFATSISLAREDIMIKKILEEFGKLPLGNIQANATQVKKTKKVLIFN